MLSVPTTDQVLEGIARTLDDVVLPKLADEPARVAVQMIQQLLRGAAVRAAHEIAWMHTEIDQIRAVAAEHVEAAPVTAALAALDAPHVPAGLDLADVQARYALAGEVLSCAAEAAFATGDDAAVARVRAVLEHRCGHEALILGQLDLVGRG